MSANRTTLVTLTTRIRPWWAWRLIALLRWLHATTGALLTLVER